LRTDTVSLIAFICWCVLGAVLNNTVSPQTTFFLTVGMGGTMYYAIMRWCAWRDARNEQRFAETIREQRKKMNESIREINERARS
jgi:arginine exporter protein ArgO